MSRVKIAEEIVFFVFLFRNFSNFEQNIFRLWPKNFKNLSKLPSTCPEEQFVAWIFFRFRIVLDFLQKPSAWFPKFYIRVQSKNCGRNNFFFFPEFSRILTKFFSDFWPKNFEKLSKLPYTCPEEHFVAWFFLSFETFGVSAETFGMVPKLLYTCPE